MSTTDPEADLKSATCKPPRHYPWDVVGSFSNTIGVLWPCYGSGHVVYGLDTKRYRHRTLAKATLAALDRRSTFFRSTPFVLDASVPLLHTFNVLPVNKDFVVSHELELPRFLGAPSPARLQRGLRLLASRRCKAILPMSEFAQRFVAKRFRRHGFASLLEKTSIFRGAMASAAPGAGEAAESGPRPSFAERPLSAIVVGSQLFRKGGMQAIVAFERLRATGLDVRLTLVGDFETECYALRECLPDSKLWRARAKTHPWIRFRGPLPNAAVLAELRDHDLCLYPSLDESLGWLTIEAQMLGVPVVGNRVCAYPELIGHRKTGWLIDLPVDDDGRWAGVRAQGDAHAAAVADAQEAIMRGIEACVRHVHASPDALATWGAEGRRAMNDLYGMAAASARLEAIYDRALGRA